MDKIRVDKAFEFFDDYNKRDPKEIIWDGKRYPEEYFFALKLHNWVLKLQPNANEALMLASRCQHIGRWEIPRNTYPDGKAGYLSWRTNLSKYHASVATKLLLQIGFQPSTIESVCTIILKQQIKVNSDVQIMENALCLFFLEYQYVNFILKHDDTKVIRILQKSWNKMDDNGREMALKLNFKGRALQLLQHALT